MSAREQWTVPDVATHIKVEPSTVTSYRARGQMPEPDGYMGRTPWWWADTIRAWHESRRSQKKSP